MQFQEQDFVRIGPRTFGEATELPPTQLELELTESLLMHGGSQLVGRVRQLKALGISISIDDFGTGYSSLAYLKRFAVDRLKVDRSLIADLHEATSRRGDGSALHRTRPHPWLAHGGGGG